MQHAALLQTIPYYIIFALPSIVSLAAESGPVSVSMGGPSTCRYEKRKSAVLASAQEYFTQRGCGLDHGGPFAAVSQTDKRVDEGADLQRGRASWENAGLGTGL